ncbi:MAG: SPOR domain-containing protein [Prevotella sp.]|nr:SPOR domain-containing protein [Prevotella sp.]MBR4925919.1 SPOR domain-containing protein [Prevotella sp.]
MKQLLLTFVLAIAGMTVADAQNFLQNLQQPQQGQGVVTVHEKAAIDSLVNNIQPPAPVKKPDNAGKKEDNKEKKDDKSKTDSTKTETAKPDSTKTEGEQTRVLVEHRQPTVDENAPVDTRKKVMKHGRHVNGFRIQVYRGGGTRDAKQKAQSVGNQLKNKFPGQPVYTHFYSPNWTVRMGNFKTQEEAVRMLRQVKNAGFSSATLVRGPITVSQ